MGLHRGCHESAAHAVQNRLLALLPSELLERVLHRSEVISLTTKQLLSVEGQRLESAYFPVNCVLSLLSRVDAESFVEVATIGREGMFGTSFVLGTDTTANRCFNQIPGDCVRVPAEVMKEELVQAGPLWVILQSYVHTLMVQLAQGVACNARHTVEQRCARWLLMSRDRVDTDEIPLTQEFLCQMLGVRRATVSEIAGRFQVAGLIRYVRGKLNIVDPDGLRSVSCGCYTIIRNEYEHQVDQRPWAPRGQQAAEVDGDDR